MPMFAVNRHYDIYPSYVLADLDCGSRLSVVPERGAIVTSWQIGDRELLYLDRDRFLDPNLSVRGGIPILFPICGNLPENTYTLDNRTYTLKQHGFARDLPWRVVAEDTKDAASLSLVLESNAATKSVYPFDFTVRFTYSLRGNELRIDREFTNHSDVPMPMSTGLHPYFVTANKESLEFNIPASSYQNQRDKSIHPFSGKFDFTQAEIDVGFTDLSDTTATVIDGRAGTKIDFTVDKLDRHLVFWTLADRDFYCLEPWTAPRNSMNTAKDLISIAPGATLAIPFVLNAQIDSTR
jgi:galactose mutarotase-like enzyme